MTNKMTNKITKKKSNGKINLQLNEAINTYKNACQEAEDCLLKNLPPSLRKQVLAILNDCKKENENVPYFEKKQIGIRQCALNKYLKANISSNVMDIEFSKCMDKLNKKKDLLKELSMLLNPDEKKKSELLDKFNKMVTIGNNCINTYCAGITQGRDRQKCIKDHKCFGSKTKHNFNKILKIEKKTQKILNKIK